ncbi:MAG: Ger(x)C family spore germination C-terminal domain-containing protein [Lawsonibacter sp.]|jgi:spore germination protein KC
MRAGIGILALLCMLLSGCSVLPYPREMEDMALLRTMGVDREEDGLLVTVSTGPRARGLQGEQEPALVLSAQRGSLSSAALAIQALSDSYVFFGYIDQLLLGEELVKSGVVPVLDYYARDVELGLGVQLWVVQGAMAQQAVESGGEEGVDQRLSTLRTDGEMGVAAISRTALDVYSDLLELGCCYIPALVLSSQDGATLMESGYAVVQTEGLAGFLEGEAARGLELLAGKPSADVLEMELPQGIVTVRVSKAVTVCSLDRNGRLELSCRVSAHLVERPDTVRDEELEKLRKALEERELGRVQAVLDQLRQWQTDCLGLGAKGSLRTPGVWRGIEEDWPQQFANQTPNVDLKVEIHR